MAQRKETKKTIQIRDLKPKKDAKGGASGRTHNPNQANKNQGRNPTIMTTMGG